MHKIILTFLFGLGCISIQAQKFSRISSDFSILEKNTLKDTSFLVVGNLSYDLNEDKTTYKVRFPETKTWEFKDSILVVYDSLSRIEKVDTIGLVNELSVFKKILNDDLADFGLLKGGFKVSEVQKSGNSVLLRWTPPVHIKFIKEVISKKDNNKLSGLIIIDENEKEISKVFYEDYIVVSDLPVPTVIKSQMVGDKEQIFKELQFRNVIIE